MRNSISKSTPISGNPGSIVASGKKIGLHQPSNDNEISDKLKGVDLASHGVKVHDHLGDKRGNGVAGDYDDSIKHNADAHYVNDKAAKRPKE